MFGPDIFKAFGIPGIPEPGAEQQAVPGGAPVAANPIAPPAAPAATPGPAANANPAANAAGALSGSPLAPSPLKGVL